MTVDKMNQYKLPKIATKWFGDGKLCDEAISQCTRKEKEMQSNVVDLPLDVNEHHIFWNWRELEDVDNVPKSGNLCSINTLLEFCLKVNTEWNNDRIRTLCTLLTLMWKHRGMYSESNLPSQWITAKDEKITHLTAISTMTITDLLMNIFIVKRLTLNSKTWKEWLGNGTKPRQVNMKNLSLKLWDLFKPTCQFLRAYKIKIENLHARMKRQEEEDEQEEDDDDEDDSDDGFNSNDEDNKDQKQEEEEDDEDDQEEDSDDGFEDSAHDNDNNNDNDNNDAAQSQG